MGDLAKDLRKSVKDVDPKDVSLGNRHIVARRGSSVIQRYGVQEDPVIGTPPPEVEDAFLDYKDEQLEDADTKQVSESEADDHKEEHEDKKEEGTTVINDQGRNKERTEDHGVKRTSALEGDATDKILKIMDYVGQGLTFEEAKDKVDGEFDTATDNQPEPKEDPQYGEVEMATASKKQASGSFKVGDWAYLDDNSVASAIVSTWEPTDSDASWHKDFENDSQYARGEEGQIERIENYGSKQMALMDFGSVKFWTEVNALLTEDEYDQKFADHSDDKEASRKLSDLKSRLAVMDDNDVTTQVAQWVRDADSEAVMVLKEGPTLFYIALPADMIDEAKRISGFTIRTDEYGYGYISLDKPEGDVVAIAESIAQAGGFTKVSSKKIAMDSDSVSVYFDLVFEDYNFEEDHPNEQVDEEKYSEDRAYQDISSKLSSFGTVGNEGHAEAGLVCYVDVNLSQLSSLRDWISSNQGSEGTIELSEQYYAAQNFEIVPTPGRGETYDWPHGWDDFIDENVKISNKNKVPIGESGVKMNTRLPRRAAEEKEIPVGQDKTKENEGPEDKEAKVTASEFARRRRSGNEDNFGGRQAEPFKAEDAPKAEDKPEGDVVAIAESIAQAGGFTKVSSKKIAMDSDSVSVYFDLVFEDYNFEEDHPNEQVDEEKYSEDRAYQDISSKLSSFGTVGNEGHAEAGLVCYVDVNLSQLSSLRDWISSNQGSEGTIELSEQYYAAQNFEIVPTPGRGETYDWPHGWDDFIDENVKISNKNKVPIGESGVKMNTRLPRRAAEEKEIPVGQDKTKENEGPEDKEAKVTASEFARRRRSGNEDNFGGRQAEPFKAEDAPKAEDKPEEKKESRSKRLLRAVNVIIAEAIGDEDHKEPDADNKGGPSDNDKDNKPEMKARRLRLAAEAEKAVEEAEAKEKEFKEAHRKAMLAIRRAEADGTEAIAPKMNVPTEGDLPNRTEPVKTERLFRRADDTNPFADDTPTKKPEDKADAKPNAKSESEEEKAARFRRQRLMALRTRAQGVPTKSQEGGGALGKSVDGKPDIANEAKNLYNNDKSKGKSQEIAEEGKVPSQQRYPHPSNESVSEYEVGNATTLDNPKMGSNDRIQRLRDIRRITSTTPPRDARIAGLQDRVASANKHIADLAKKARILEAEKLVDMMIQKGLLVQARRDEEMAFLVKADRALWESSKRIVENAPPARAAARDQADPTRSRRLAVAQRSIEQGYGPMARQASVQASSASSLDSGNFFDN